MSPAAPVVPIEPDPEKSLRRQGFLTIGLFDPTAPAVGHEDTLRLIQLGEDLDEGDRLGEPLDCFYPGACVVATFAQLLVELRAGGPAAQVGQ